MKTKRIKAEDLSAEEIALIDAFIEDNAGLVFHCVEFNKIAAKFAGTELGYWLAYDEGSMVALLPVHLVRGGVSKHYISGLTTFEIPYGGWVHGPDIDIRVLSKWSKLKLNETLLICASFLSDDTFMGTGLTRETALIDLQNADMDSLWNRIDSKRKNMIRKAEKNGIQVHVLDQDDIADFYVLLQQMHRSKGFKSKTERYYGEIHQAFCFRKARVLVACLNDTPVSTIMLVGNKNAWHYWQGATDTKYNLGAGELLQWHAIQYAFSQGSKLYDMCVIERDKLPNIASYKLSFGAEPCNYRVVTQRPFSARLINRVSRIAKKRR